MTAMVTWLSPSDPLHWISWELASRFLVASARLRDKSVPALLPPCRRQHQVHPRRLSGCRRNSCKSKRATTADKLESFYWLSAACPEIARKRLAAVPFRHALRVSLTKSE